MKIQLPDPAPEKKNWPWSAPEGMEVIDPQGMTEWPRISIVTPSFNQAQFLEETIRSVLLQGYPNLDYWVIDGGSTDGSVEIIRKYQAWLSGWVSEKDAGQADAINKGWRRSTGSFMGYLNSDDLLAPGCLAREMTFFAQNPPVDLLYGDLVLFEEDLQSGHRQSFSLYSLEELLTTQKWIPQQGTLFRRRVYNALGDLDASLRFAMDYDYFLKARAQFQLAYLPEVLAYFRYHPDSKTVSRLYMSGDDGVQIYRNFFDSPHLSAGVKHLEKTATANAWYTSAIAYYMSDRQGEALRQLFTAFRFEPCKTIQKDFLKLLLKTLLSALLGGRNNPIFNFIVRK